jgi:hypothetical protein
MFAVRTELFLVLVFFGPGSRINAQGTLRHWEEPAVMILDLERDFSDCFVSFRMSWLFGSLLLR